MGAAMLAMALLASGCATTPSHSARKHFERTLAKAQQGDVDAQFSVSASYEYGVQKDEKKALYWLRKAAEGGHRTALTAMWLRYLDGKGVKQDEKKASYWMRKAAEGGDGTSQLMLGRRYRDGKGVKQDEKKALYWLHKAMRHKHYEIYQSELAALYEGGKHIKRDLRKAADLYQKSIAAMLSSVNSVHYAEHIQQSRNALVRVFKKRGLANKITKGDKKALRESIKLASGQDEVAKASKAMLEELLQSGVFIVAEALANQGEAEAQFMLGENYRLGKGVKKNAGLAIFWYKKAAEQGLLKAEGAIAKLAN